MGRSRYFNLAFRLLWVEELVAAGRGDSGRASAKTGKSSTGTRTVSF